MLCGAAIVPISRRTKLKPKAAQLPPRRPWGPRWEARGGGHGQPLSSTFMALLSTSAAFSQRTEQLGRGCVCFSEPETGYLQAESWPPGPAGTRGPVSGRFPSGFPLGHHLGRGPSGQGWSPPLTAQFSPRSPRTLVAEEGAWAGARQGPAQRRGGLPDRPLAELGRGVSSFLRLTSHYVCRAHPVYALILGWTLGLPPPFGRAEEAASSALPSPSSPVLLWCGPRHLSPGSLQTSLACPLPGRSSRRSIGTFLEYRSANSLPSLKPSVAPQSPRVSLDSQDLTPTCIPSRQPRLCLCLRGTQTGLLRPCSHYLESSASFFSW
ncbi:uncharacterized protein [Physeter macrocephalus]|uniref:Uncharacterized protein isoform X1 n=1 Tax=Physeter macrocephalus TaxID=9755 RepID=A0A455B7R5_PHYMC|nr:uncharacterized protein LOC114486083 isoform X1 [Physeter catodon]|eukprot:XP_028344038.1 uncharacterized protein LOC114486083 isoform X1 [Physeter catodon]